MPFAMKFLLKVTLTLIAAVIAFSYTNLVPILVQSGGRIGLSIQRNRPSLQEYTDMFPFNNIKNASSNLTPTCINAAEDSILIVDSIKRAVNFYETHIDKFNVFDSAVGLQVLKGVMEQSNKFGKQNEQHFGIDFLKNISPIIERIYQQALQAKTNPQYKHRVEAFVSSPHIWKRLFEYWKPLSDLNKKRGEFHGIGKDEDTILSEVNAHCQSTLLHNCEIPDICNATFLDPEPQSQYMLTHQALYLIFAQHKSCDNVHRDVFKDLETNLQRYCVKILLEAEFIAKHGFPFWGRDLIAEQIAICGLAGYPNLLRQDWIRQIISWQSTSNNGCFLNPEGNYILFDDFIPRRLTEAEKHNTPTVSSTEICLPHLTSVSLSALAVKLGWLIDTCSI